VLVPKFRDHLIRLRYPSTSKERVLNDHIRVRPLLCWLEKLGNQVLSLLRDMIL
jgi:hypothetical protein